MEMVLDDHMALIVPLRAGERRLLVFLRRLSQPVGFVEIPSMELAARLGVDRSTVWRQLRSLEQHGLITTKRLHKVHCRPSRLRIDLVGDAS